MELTIEDRLALRSLVDAYAEAVDRKDPAAVAALFAPDGRLVVPDPSGRPTRSSVRHGRDEIASALAGLGRYRALTHVVGGQVVRAVGPGAGAPADAAASTGVTTCLAHHVYERDGRARLLVLGIQYHDAYRRHGGRWLFAERRLRIGWRDDRALDEGAP